MGKNFRVYLVALAGTALALSVAALPAQAGMGMPSKQQMETAAPISLSTPIDPSYTADNAAFVANGCGLRNKTSCVINVSGIPGHSTVKKAFLYWAYTSTTGAGRWPQKTIYLRGNAIDNGKLMGNGDDACWCGGTNVVYRANVTPLVTGNGNYNIRIPRQGVTLANGASPWDLTVCPSEPYQGLAEGASLVVIYTNSANFSTAGATTLVYDSGLAGQEFDTGTFSYDLSSVPAPVSGTDIFTEIGADGQAGNGYDGSASLEDTSLNSTVIAGINAASGFDLDSDWNGSDAGPMNQLWDTHSHDVTGVLTGGTNSVSIYAPDDCLIGVANVLTVR